MTPQQAAAEYLELLASDRVSGTHKAMSFAMRYEGELCQSEADYDIYLELIG